MLHPLIFLIFLTFSRAEASAHRLESGREGCLNQTNSCKVSSLKGNLPEDIRAFQEEADQKVKRVLQDKEFQDFVAQVRKQIKEPKDKINSLFKETQSSLDSRKQTSTSCYIFVSFSLGEKALLNLAQDAKRWGATLVLRGFREGSYKKTALALQKIIQETGQGFIIDPELFSLFAITSVPTIILSKPFPLLSADQVQTPLHDRLQGHVSLQYALETFSKEGDLKNEAKVYLMKEKDL